MTLVRAVPFAALALAGSLLAACSGTTVPYTFEGEPVCPDFSIGGAEPVRGGLKKPIHVAFKEGDTIVSQVVLVGLRTADAPATPILLPDSDGEYDVVWSTCGNERAPAPAAVKGSPSDMKYECGEHAEFARTKLTTTKGDPARKIPVTAPADPACWSAAAPAAATASASAPPAPPPVPEVTADPAASASAAGSASAGPPGSASAAPSVSAPPGTPTPVAPGAAPSPAAPPARPPSPPATAPRP